METKAELKKVISKARNKLDKIESAEKSIEMDKVVGRCFKTRNNYSLPEKQSDYWWLYAKAVKQTKDGNLEIFRFQVDKYGRITIEAKELAFWPHHFQDWQAITVYQFNKAWRNLVGRIDGINPEVEQK